MSKSAYFHGCTFLAALAILVGLIFARPTEPESSLPAIQSVHTVTVERCAECHAEICDSYKQTPHLRTLRKPTDADVFNHFVGKQVTSRGVAFAFEQRGEAVVMTSEDSGVEKKVDWMFGSGEHALTGVSVDVSPRGETEIQQLNVSWFPHCNLAATPGSNHSPENPLLGVHLAAAESLKCFECHSSSMSVDDGQIDFASLEPGINCIRCHSNAQQHASSDGSLPSGVAWDKLSPLESIGRCGECHRRPDEFTDDELTPDNAMLVRFAPVGLSQSPCFKAQFDSHDGQRLDCITCHDPHAPAAKNIGFYTAKCNACHGSQSAGSICPDSPASDDCMHCHMPIVENENVRVTDHWIRIRRDRNFLEN